MDSQDNEDWPGFEHRKFVLMIDTVWKFKFHLFSRHAVSLVRIVSGVDKYVTESMPTAEQEHTAAVKPVAKEDQDRSLQ